MADVHKRVHVPVSKMVGDSSAMDVFAGRVKQELMRTAAQHRKTGSYISHFKIKRIPGRGVAGYVADRLIYNDDPEAVQIEWGQWRDRADKSRGYAPGTLVFTRTLGRL